MFQALSFSNFLFWLFFAPGEAWIGLLDVCFPTAGHPLNAENLESRRMELREARYPLSDLEVHYDMSVMATTYTVR